MSKLFKMSVKSLASTGENAFVEEIKRLKKVIVLDVIKLKEKTKANVTGIKGKRFVSIRGENEKIYKLIGLDVFAKIVLAVNASTASIEELVNVEMIKPELEAKLLDSFGSATSEAFNRQIAYRDEAIAEATKEKKSSKASSKAKN